MKKKLLSEAQVRRFMGLAGLNPVNEMAYKSHDDKKMEETYNVSEEDLMEEEDAMGDDMGDDMGDKADVEIDEEALMRIKKNLDELQDDLAPLLDQAEGDMEDPEADEEPTGDMDPDMGGDDEEKGDEDLDALDDADVEMEPTDNEKEEMEEEIVNEVARRVAKRIVEAKRAHKKMNEALGRKR